jgi:hypothetical protein
MKLGLRRPRRKARRSRHGDVPAAPRPAAVAYQGGHEIRVYEGPRGYYPVVTGAGTRARVFSTIREAVAEGRFLTERMATRSSAAYSRSRRSRRR